MAEEKKFDGNKMVMTTIFIVVTAVIFLAIGYVAGRASSDYANSSIDATTATEDDTIYTEEDGTTAVSTTATDEETTTDTAVGEPVTATETATAID